MSDQQSSSDRLVRVEASVGNLNEKVDALNEKADRFLYAIEGNGTPGLKVRVDRLEQREESRAKWMGVAVAASISGILVALWTGFKVLVTGRS